ncbi:MAG: hypothetical protein IJO68_05350 [Clostridia bacterium]|nr:hypothetical protein [Clostridia bacterium]
MIIKSLAYFMALIITAFSGWFGLDAPQYLDVVDITEYQTFEGFGTSTCWWAQTIDTEAKADAIAKALFSDSEGLGLDIVRYNIGGGEKDNPDTRIWDTSRRTESFYVYDEAQGEYIYDFTRDANARRVLDKAIEYGAKEVVLFCNSPHFSMTKSGHASGGFEEYSSNLPEENYDEFVDYVLTIADWFVEEGYPVTYISPINEPQWGWGGEWVGQEGCHYEPDEAVKLLEMFAKEMQERNTPYKLSGVETGQVIWWYNDYLFKFFENETLNSYCDTFSGHSYWLDGNKDEKRSFGNTFKDRYPDKRFEMSEWCELPLTIDSMTIDSGLHMANVMIEDLTLLNAVSWQSWTAFNGDGVLYEENGEIKMYNRYWAYKQFSSFIEEGMTRVKVFDEIGLDEGLAKVAFTNDKKTVLVVVNNEEQEKEVKFLEKYPHTEIFVTDSEHNCECVEDELLCSGYTLPPKSITTFVFNKTIF